MAGGGGGLIVRSVRHRTGSLPKLTASEYPGPHGRVVTGAVFRMQRETTQALVRHQGKDYLPRGLFDYKTSHMLRTVVCLLCGLRVCHLSIEVFERGLGDRIDP